MSERKWTPEQRSAIDAESGSLLVSAAAGSGKTSVLTERAVRKLTEPDITKRIKPEELLVVTFTNAAAAEMRTRIYSRINELMRLHPDDVSLSSLRMKLELAEICTIDSFCSRLVRENFHDAGISPDFRILDQSESKVLCSQIVKLTVEELHSQRGEPFAALCNLFTQGRDDSNLTKSIIKLCEYSYAHPFPLDWLDSVADMYSGELPENTEWGKQILEFAADGLEYCRDLISDSLEIVKTEKDSEKAYAAALESDLNFLQKAHQLVSDAKWDKAVEYIGTFKKERLGQLRNKELEEMKQTVKTRREEMSAILKRIAESMCANTEEHAEDMSVLRPSVSELINAVKLYSKRLYEAKQEMNAYDFSDISSSALALLAEKSDGGYRKTELAERLSHGYKEIMIDEYQDTNEGQDMLFECLSVNGENLFMVGDIKQSIYRFRLAMPEIFNGKSAEYPYYDGQERKSKIILGKNFRSNAGVIDAVNTLFSRVMSKKTGDIEYSDDERLYCGKTDEPSESPDVCLRIIDVPSSVKAAQRRAFEADYAAKLIKKHISEGLTVPDGTPDGRPAKASDFCILVRNLKGCVKIFSDAFSKNGLKCITDGSDDFFEAREISVILSLLRCADNPTREVDLLAVMLSPVFGFTVDELAQIRIDNRSTGLWRCVCEAAQTNMHFKAFFDEIEEYRTLAASLPAGEFIRTVYDRTAYVEIACAEKNEMSAKNNLLLLLKYASDFDMRSPGSGLPGFVRYIDALVQNEGKLASASSASGENAVRIMTIHKSKGLEFPFVIIADTSHEFNYKDLNESLLISNNLGIGFKRKDRPALRIFPTVPYAAVRIEQKRATVSEELRILYVAMTRAREKLFILSSLKNADKKISELSVLSVPGKVLSPFFVFSAASPAEWLSCGFMPSLFSRCEGETKIDYAVINPFSEAEENTEETQPEQPEIIADEKLLREIKNLAEQEYKYAAVSAAPTKRTASDLYSDSYNDEFFASTKPAFMFGGSLSPAEKGTATHRFLQFCDMTHAAASPKAELERLVGVQRLSPREASAVELDTVAAFFADEVYLRACKSDRVYREKKFTVAAPASLFSPGLPAQADTEMTVVIGEIDLLFTENGKTVIVDYKTDRVDSAEKLTDRYSTQLKMYAYAAEQSLCIPVSECIIYSLHMKKAICVPLENT